MSENPQNQKKKNKKKMKEAAIDTCKMSVNERASLQILLTQSSFFN